MTKKADFNADEWATVVEGPLLAGMRVITAGRGGTLRESLAMGQTYAKARQAQGSSELLDELVSAPPAMDPSRLRSAGDIASMSTERLRHALQICSGRPPPTMSMRTSASFLRSRRKPPTHIARVGFSEWEVSR